MTTTTSSENVPAAERITAMHDAIWNSVVRVEISHEVDRQPKDIDFRLQVASIGNIVMFSAKSSPVTIERTPELARDDAEPEIVVGLQLAGSSSMVQNGRHATVRRGEFVIWDTSAPYTLIFNHRANQQFFRIPRAALALPVASLRELTATTLGQDNPLSRFVSSYLSRMAANKELQTDPTGQALAQPTIELLRGALSTELQASKYSRPALEATLELRILDYMGRHLSESDLTAKRVAFAHHISIRYLYVVLARAGIAPGEWIRSHRLEACRRELAEPAASSRTITETAFRWGFSDGARFSRMFKTAYGLSPREWRAISQGA